jgi:hypothetical protein
VLRVVVVVKVVGTQCCALWRPPPKAVKRRVKTRTTVKEDFPFSSSPLNFGSFITHVHPVTSLTNLLPGIAFNHFHHRHASTCLRTLFRSL